MTKTIILDDCPADSKKQPEKIQLIEYLDYNKEFRGSSAIGRNYNFLELICRNYLEVEDVFYDLIFAYDDPLNRTGGVLYLGHWNDGVV